MCKKQFAAVLLGILSFIGCSQEGNHKDVLWPEINKEQKPWTRWWWMGNAVDSAGIKQNLISFSKAGLGGVEIQPIYGVKGEEDRFIEHLSPEWLAMLDYTIKVADSLQMGVDMTLGTGWPYGGPQVEIEHAATRLIHVKKELKKGEILNQFIGDSTVKKLPLTLKGVYAYADDGEYKDLTQRLGHKKEKWEAKDKNYDVYFVYEAKTGQQVKRAAPGGKGFTVDHYSSKAWNDYIEPYNKALPELDGTLRSVFNDSYEVYGTDFSPRFFEEFEERRGYDLRKYLNRLFEKKDDEISNRVRSDYRETLSDLLLEEFDRPWTAWANSKGMKSRLQAHGSPGNLIDFYASADIPECETFGSMPYDIPGFRRLEENIRKGDANPVMLKFSSSAGHISGKPLISSETFTWLREHFKTALSQCKPEVEDLFLSGINHVFLHGSTYSPERAAWPGWKFYASVNFNQNNSIWEDAPELFRYMANCQSFLQQGKPDNELLLYYPIHDTWNKYLKGNLFFQFKIHSLNEWLLNTPFYQLTQDLMENGYNMDFISDRFVEQIALEGNSIVLPGEKYKALVVPQSHTMPLETLKKLTELQKQGANIIFMEAPETIPGNYDVERRNTELKSVTENIDLTSNLYEELQDANVIKEDLIDLGLKYIRRDVDGEKVYYIVNHTLETVKELPINISTEQVTIYDPLTGEVGKARIIAKNDKTVVGITILPGQSFILKTGIDTGVGPWLYTEPMGEEYKVEGKWKLSFLKGGPSLPSDIELNDLKSWTALNDETKAFSGTAVYEITFNLPDTDAEYWELDFGDVRESAKVWVNGEYAGALWSVPYQLKTSLFKKGENTLKIQVTNLPANRIKALESSGKEWKIFHEINMVNKDYQKFDATQWKDTPSGLLTPVVIQPLNVMNKNQ
ncbi:glycosyl hydrolase [Galbibacter sp. EGI 63066]|uniref:glycosyl hydrolase n=1 Tax=Galbibacter sp. EGI 63066 TaxID=2993559 RepID=UPI002248D272|nr:glycosyl hydrolase [Galbibacter sp. EGI 63066]MCX2680304.1 glycosyl hydrolase [Galbibacter sp. EGI 63066]